MSLSRSLISLCESLTEFRLPRGIHLKTSSNTWLDHNLDVLSELPEMDGRSEIAFRLERGHDIIISKVDSRFNPTLGFANIGEDPKHHIRFEQMVGPEERN